MVPKQATDSVFPNAVDAPVANVFYLDLVGYSKLTAVDQSVLLAKLQSIVQAQLECEHAPCGEKIVLQIGDGIAVIFFQTPQDPVRLAVHLAGILKTNAIEARIGVHSGPVIRITDLTGRPNVAGPGINQAQRVMSFGDAGHILVSGLVKDYLCGIEEEWKDCFRDLGFQVVKHGDKIRIFNLCTGNVGNPATPRALSRQKIPVAGPIAPRWRKTTAWIMVISTAAAGLLYYVTRPSPPPDFVSYIKLTDALGEKVYPSISPQGDQLVYASKRKGNWNIYSQKFLKDGTLDPNDTNITSDSAAGDTQPAFSRDGSHIAFRSERESGGIFTMNETGGNPVLVTTEGYNPSWSPDGNKIVVATESIIRPEDRVSSKSPLWMIRRKGEGHPWIRDLKPIYEGDAVQPAWSPNGCRIAFWQTHNGHRDVATIPATGGAPVVGVNNYQGINWNPVWAPDGRYLYFSSDRSGNMNLWRVPIDECSGRMGDAEPVTKSASDISHISFQSLDKMVFIQRELKSNLHRVKFDPVGEKTVEGSIEPITNGSKQATRLDLSPDNEWLTYTYSRGKQEEIFVISKDGKNSWRVADGGRTDRNPRWSPDGERIAFFSRRSDKNEIWIAGKRGNPGPKPLTHQGGVIYPVWSPDGKRLAYTIQTNAQPGKADKQPFIATILPSDNLTPGKPLPPLSEPGESFTVWSWSPNGEWLAGYRQKEEAFTGITIYSIRDERFRKLTASGSDPIWLSDNRRLLYFDSGKIFLVHIDPPYQKKEILQVSPHDIARRGFSINRDDGWIYFSQDEAEADVWLATTARGNEGLKTLTAGMQPGGGDSDAPSAAQK